MQRLTNNMLMTMIMIIIINVIDCFRVPFQHPTPNYDGGCFYVSDSDTVFRYYSQGRRWNERKRIRRERDISDPRLPVVGRSGREAGRPGSLATPSLSRLHVPLSHSPTYPDRVCDMAVPPPAAKSNQDFDAAIIGRIDIAIHVNIMKKMEQII